MKIFKTKILWGLAGLALVVGSCTEDFVTARAEGSFTEENYYRTRDQSFSGLIAVYDVLRKNSGGFENMITMFNAGSDDFYAGGGGPSDGVGIHAFDNFSINPLTVPRSYFGDFYRGIARANILIQKLPEADFDETEKARFLAEAKALRAFYYFQLVTMFKNIPLITEPLQTSVLFEIPQADPADVYAFIEAEMLEAIPALPATLSPEESGRLSQGAVKALLGKVYLFEEKWAEAAAQFADVNGTPGGTSLYGYKLLTNFADLWLVDNRFNTEAILQTSHTNASRSSWDNWGTGSDEGNSVNQMVGPRGFTRPEGSTVPSYIAGWSFNPVTPALYTAMLGDPRFAATILDMPALVAAGQANYAPGDQDTGYFLKKFMPLTTETTTIGGTPELNYRQNTYILRLADSYLMEAEALFHTGNLDRAQDLLDAVRNRVGLGSVTVTLDAIYNERRLELAGEGQRFHDLVRTGRTQLLTPSGFVPGKNEILPIPFEDISNTILDQNPEY